jgi:hypothetical protein
VCLTENYHIHRWLHCDEPPICAMCECGNHLAPCADLLMQVSHMSERLLDS